MSQTLKNTLIWITVYAIAMAFLESAVVVYLRELYYPDQIIFPMKQIGGTIAYTELLRELATLIMIIAVATLASNSAKGRFAWFIYIFAIWDIFYYVFFKHLVNWPASILEWDILFLLPFTWVGPVIAPIINSICMIILAMLIHLLIDKHGSLRISKYPWMLLILGSLLVIGAYTQEYVTFMSSHFSIFELLNPANGDAIIELATKFLPQHFNWWIFGLGVVMHLLAMGLILRKNKQW